MSEQQANEEIKMPERKKMAEGYLSVIREKESEIRDKELELEALRYKASGAGGIDYSKERVQTTPTNYTEMAIIDVVEISQEIEEDRASIEEAKGTAYAIVRLMKNAEQRTLIEWFYLNCVSIPEVARKMCRSERSVYYLREDALEEFGRILQTV